MNKLTPRDPTPDIAKLILDYGQACFECGAYDGNVGHEYQFLSDARALAHRLLVAKIGAMHDAAPSAEPVADEPVAWALFTNKPKSPRIRTLSADPPSAEYLEIAQIEGEAWRPLYTRPAPAPAERGEYPPLPEPFQRLYGQEERMAWADQMRAYVDADRAQRAPLTDLNQLPGRDWCTDPDNCRRCKAATWDQKKYHHAGIPLDGIGAKP